MARYQRRTVLLNLPLHVQTEGTPGGRRPCSRSHLPRSHRTPSTWPRSRRPSSGPSARSSWPGEVPGAARAPLEAVAERYGALLATSAVARGPVRREPLVARRFRRLRVAAGGRADREADLIVGWGCALNMWTMRHGRLIGAEATVVQVDDTPRCPRRTPGHPARRRRRRRGDGGGVARPCRLRGTGVRYRTDELHDRIAREIRWRDVGYEDASSGERIDPRSLSIALDDLLPPERVVAVDSGNFMGYPSMYLSVPDQRGFCFTQAFQSIGLGLATAIGAALAQPDRLPVAALGDGGALMAAAELDTVRRSVSRWWW